MHDGETVAVRNASGFSFLFGDHQATALTAVAFGVGQTVTRRKQLPFGGSRSSTGSADWPGDRGFLGGTSDPTGYTHLGAREYDPATGRFLSVDPLFLAGDPTQHNGYQYGNNNPTTFADPTGEAYEECVSGQYHCSNGRTGGTGNVTKVEFGKNYEKQTRAVGGKVSKNYYTQQATGVKFTYVKGRGTTKYTASQLSAGEKRRRQADAEHKRHLAELKKQREDAEQQAKNNEKEAGFWKSTFGTWDGWKNRVLPAAGFAACVFATVGGCMIVGAGIAGTSFAITGIKDDSWEWATLGKNLAWVGAGGGSAYKLARKMGASKHDAVWGWPFVKNTRSYKTKVPGEVGVGGGRRVRVTEVHRDWGATGGNLSINAGFNFGFCSAGSYSAGNLVNVC
ncbi:RHS repeat-associated core domain-containing protein [Streptomyces sp. WA1-19]